MPKSITLIWPVWVSMTLPGLMSRWMIPCRWLNSIAAQISATISSARRGISRPSAVSTSLRVRPLTNSMTMYGSVSPAGPALLAGVVDGDDRGVVQRRGVLRLAAEPQLERVVAGEVGAQHLDRDVPAEPEVATAVHLGHAAVAEQLADLVPPPEEAGLRHRQSPFRCSMHRPPTDTDGADRRHLAR